MRTLEILKNKDFGEIGVIYENNKFYLEATGVARVLGYSNEHDAIKRHCRYEGVRFHEVGVVTGVRKDKSVAVQNVRKKYIDEGNVYRLIIRSKLESAKKFEKWVFDEILPSIRQEGMYMTEDKYMELLDNPDLIIGICKKIKEKDKQIIEIENTCSYLKDSLDTNKPYTTLGKTISNVDDAITVGQFAKILSNDVYVGRNRLYRWFRDNGYIIKSGKDKNMPKQAYLEKGLFRISEKIVNTKDGEILSTRLLITGKGQAYFSELYLKDYCIENQVYNKNLSIYDDVYI